MKKVIFALGILSVCVFGFVACSEDNGCPSGGSYNSASSETACATASYQRYGSKGYYCFADNDCYIYDHNPN